MKRGPRCVIATALSASAIVVGCGEDRETAARNAASDTAYFLEEAAIVGQEVEVLQAAVHASDVNVRRIPLLRNTNNAGLIDGVQTAKTDALLMRPFVLNSPGDAKLSDQIWIGGYFKDLPWAEAATTQTLGFIAVTPDTIKRMTVYSRLKTSVQLCPDHVSGTAMVSVEYNEAQTPILRDSGTVKAIATAIEVQKDQSPSGLLSPEYVAAKAC